MSDLKPGDAIPELHVTPDKYLPHRYAGASGDFNPIHVDPEFAKSVGLPSNILHGLYSMGLVAKAAAQGLAGGDPRALKKLTVQFRGMGLPEQEVVVTGDGQGGRRRPHHGRSRGRPGRDPHHPQRPGRARSLVAGRGGPFAHELREVRSGAPGPPPEAPRRRLLSFKGAHRAPRTHSATASSTRISPRRGRCRRKKWPRCRGSSGARRRCVRSWRCSRRRAT